MAPAPAVPSMPLFVVGQPRSGSTIVTRVLNEPGDYFILNDFYGLQAIDAEGLWDRTDAEGAARVAEIVFDRIEIRATQEKGKTLEQSIDLSTESVEELRALSLGGWTSGAKWHEVVDRLMTRAAQLAGCANWGWNTPQDHLHLWRLLEFWPKARVLFVLRAPEAVLKSYKNVSGPWHDARRYNPATVGFAWKKAAANYRRAKDDIPDQVMLLKYEDLVADTSGSLARLASFLGTPFPQMDLAAFGRNSSLDAGRQLKTVTKSEVWLAEKIIHSELSELGFPASHPRFTGSGLLTLVASLAGSGLFLTKQVLTDVNRRKRALNFLRRS